MKGRLLALIVILASLVSAAPGFAATVSGDLKIFVLNVGQGDAILIICPHGTHQLLIDAGARGYPGSQEAFTQQLKALMGTDHTLEVVISTHPHDDHVAGLEFVLSTFRVNKFIDSGFPYTSTFAGVTKAVNAQVANGTLKHFKAKDFPPSRIADFCPASNVKVELLVPSGYGTSSANKNNVSVVALVTYNTQKFLFTGDAEKQEERLLLQDTSIVPKLSNVALYKVGHHGAETSSTPDLLAAMKPSVAAMSSGCKNVAKNTGYRHPRAATLDALDGIVPGVGLDERSLAAGKTAAGWTTSTIHRGIYATSADGTIAIVANGSTIRKVEQSVSGAPQACP